VQTGLADHHAVALDLADAEALADQVVQAHAVDGELAAGLALRQPGAGDDLGLDEREREARPRSLREEVAVAFEALAGEGLDRLDGTDVVLVGGPRVDGDDVYGAHLLGLALGGDLSGPVLVRGGDVAVHQRRGRVGRRPMWTQL
jgi:hypothetical protein